MARIKPTTSIKDPIPTSIIKEHIDTLLPLITEVINASIRECEFHDSWKLAVVQPLLKKSGLATIPSNYRPVSNLPFISKLTEKCVLEQLTAHFDSHDLLPQYQSAYRARFSTETAVLKLYHDFLENMENKRVTAFVAMDLSAAFDTVHHGVLLSVLENRFGIENAALKWIENYLCSRKFVVHVNDHFSEEHVINFSVPQGSMLGPVFFNAYASTLQQHISSHAVELSGYADDHGTYKGFDPRSPDAENSAITIIEDCLKTIQSWMSMNRLKMNPTKTEFIYFGSRQMLSKCVRENIQVVDDVVEISHKIKTLGVWFDSELSFRYQIDEKCKLAYLNIRNIRSIRKFISVDVCKQLVKSLVLSHLDYCNSLFYSLPYF